MFFFSLSQGTTKSISPFHLRPFDMTLIPVRCGLSAAQTREKQVLMFNDPPRESRVLHVLPAHCHWWMTKADVLGYGCICHVVARFV